MHGDDGLQAVREYLDPSADEAATEENALETGAGEREVTLQPEPRRAPAPRPGWETRRVPSCP